MLTLITTSRLSLANCSAIDRRFGISATQGAHQLAKKSRRTYLPRRSAKRQVLAIQRLDGEIRSLVAGLQGTAADRGRLERAQVERSIADSTARRNGKCMDIFADQAPPAARIARRRFVHRNVQGVVAGLEIEHPELSLLEQIQAAGWGLIRTCVSRRDLRLADHPDLGVGSRSRPVTIRPLLPIFRS